MVRSVFLVGFMGAGKTSVGRVLAKFLGWTFEDLDDRIVAREGRSIEAIFRDWGEAEFRRAELAALQEILQELTSSPPRIVALGGGAFAQPQAAELLAASANPIVFLDASPEELWRRCAAEANPRPLRRDPRQFRELYATRRPAYLQATLVVDTQGKSIEQVAGEILDSLGLRL